VTYVCRGAGKDCVDGTEEHVIKQVNEHIDESSWEVIRACGRRGEQFTMDDYEAAVNGNGRDSLNERLGYSGNTGPVSSGSVDRRGK
jgi:hypothetical protein